MDFLVHQEEDCLLNTSSLLSAVKSRRNSSYLQVLQHDKTIYNLERDEISDLPDNSNHI